LLAHQEAIEQLEYIAQTLNGNGRWEMTDEESESITIHTDGE
jgi:hypothetical protein